MAAFDSEREIKALFSGFQNPKVGLEFAKIGSLGDLLTGQAKIASKAGTTDFAADGKVLRLFASASVEMWQRGVHSFMVSAGLTLSSPVWAAVAGYYSSHYVFRAYAHLLGRFILYKERKVVCVMPGNSGFYCSLSGKNAGDREHKVYWKIVRESQLFSQDPLLTVLTEITPRADGAHRNRANYADHVAVIPEYRVFSLEEMIERINRISEIELNSVPVPNADNFPDLRNVQLAAYHRLVGFRAFLDKLLGGGNRFWTNHRNPVWCKGIIDFQRIEPNFVPVAS